LAVHRVVADHHRRADAAAPGDVGQALHRPLSHYRQWLDARRVIDGAPLGDYRLPVDARPLSVVPVKQARVGCHTTAGTLGDRLRGLPCPQQRAGDDGGHVAARRRPEPPGL
jgi:hypothetical protein